MRDVGIFSFTQNIRVTQLVSGFLSERIASCVAVDSVCPWEKVSSGASYVTILYWKLSYSFNNNIDVLLHESQILYLFFFSILFLSHLFF